MAQNGTTFAEILAHVWPTAFPRLLTPARATPPERLPDPAVSRPNITLKSTFVVDY